MEKFNGHKNWNHWNVSLWINNDEGLYNWALECVKRNKTREDAARDMFTDLKGYECYKTPDGAPYSVSSIRAAMGGM